MTMRQLIASGENGVWAAGGFDWEKVENLNPAERKAEMEMYLRDALTNIHHWADHYGLDWEYGLDPFHYDVERGTPLDEVPAP